MAAPSWDKGRVRRLLRGSARADILIAGCGRRKYSPRIWFCFAVKFPRARRATQALSWQRFALRLRRGTRQAFVGAADLGDFDDDVMLGAGQIDRMDDRLAAAEAR